MSWALTEQYSTAVIFTGTFALTFLIWRQFSKSRHHGPVRLPPCIKSVPLLGSVPYMPPVDQFQNFFLKKSYELGDVVGFKTFGFLTVVLNSHEALREVLVKQSTESADRPGITANEYMNPRYKGIIDSHYHADFKKYHQLSLSILKEFGYGQSIMENRISAEVEDLISHFEKLNGAPVNPKSYLAKSVISVISSIAIGDRLKDPQKNEAIANSVDNIFKLSMKIFLTNLIRSFMYLPHYKKALLGMVSAQDAIMNIIDERISLYTSTDPSVEQPPESFISSFISREGENFDLEQLKYTLRDFLLAGYETSSTAMTWFLLTMANIPDVQEKIQKELDSVVPRSRLPALEDKVKLPYFEAVTLEVMRYHTLVPNGLPHKVTADVTVCGYTLPKGTHVITNFYSAHMNKKSWDEPEVFRPERFLSDDGTKVINKDKVISFSLGKRSCLGELLARQEIYLFVTGLLHNFTIKPPEGVEKIEYKNVLSITMQPTPFQIRFIKRN